MTLNHGWELMRVILKPRYWQLDSTVCMSSRKLPLAEKILGVAGDLLRRKSQKNRSQLNAMFWRLQT